MSGQESGRARGPEDAHGEWHRGSWGCWDAAAVRAPCPREGRPCQAPLVPSQHQSQLLPWGGCSADPRGSPAPEQPWAPPLLRGQGWLYPGGGCSWRVLSSGAPASGLASPPQVREATGLVSFFKPTPSNVLENRWGHQNSPSPQDLCTGRSSLGTRPIPHKSGCPPSVSLSISTSTGKAQHLV